MKAKIKNIIKKSTKAFVTKKMLTKANSPFNNQLNICAF